MGTPCPPAMQVLKFGGTSIVITRTHGGRKTSISTGLRYPSCDPPRGNVRNINNEKAHSSVLHVLTKQTREDILIRQWDSHLGREAALGRGVEET